MILVLTILSEKLKLRLLCLYILKLRFQIDWAWFFETDSVIFIHFQSVWFFEPICIGLIIMRQNFIFCLLKLSWLLVSDHFLASLKSHRLTLFIFYLTVTVHLLLWLILWIHLQVLLLLPSTETFYFLSYLFFRKISKRSCGDKRIFLRQLFVRSTLIHAEWRIAFERIF